MTTQQLPPVAMAHRVTALTHLAAEQIVGADGSIWSHAATLGTRIKGSEFTIDQAVIENFITVFTTGYPQKVPVDYEHGTVSGATDFGNPVPKAGDVCELKGVYATADFTGELRTTAEKLASIAGRSLDDPKNLGLWMRWKPTNRALGMIKEREYSDLSIAFAPVEHNVTGADQGEVLISVALTNLPFLDDMLPVAASLFTVAVRGDRSTPAAGASAATHAREEQIMSTKMLAAMTALTGKAVATEDEGVTALTALQAELPALRTYAKDVAAEIGEADPAKAVAKLKELKAQHAAHELAATQAKEAAIKTSAEAKIKTYEKKLTVPMRALMLSQLVRELTAGTKLEETETVKALESMKDLGITGRSSAADVDDPNKAADPEQKQLARVKELIKTDGELIALNQKNPHAAFTRACEMVEEEQLAGAATV